MGNCIGGMKKCLDRDGDGDVDWDDFEIILGKVGQTIGSLSTLATAAAAAAVVVNPDLGKTDAYAKFQEAMGIINASNTLVQEIGRRDSKFRSLFTRLTDELEDLKEVKNPQEALTNFKEATEALNDFTQYLSEHTQLKRMFGKEFNKFQAVVTDSKKFLDAFLEAHSAVRVEMAREAGANHARDGAPAPISRSSLDVVIPDELERRVVTVDLDDVSLGSDDRTEPRRTPTPTRRTPSPTMQ